MRDVLIATVLTAAALMGGGAASAQDRVQPSLNHGSTGRAAPFFYHQVSANCETLTHTFGRNAAWGRWTLPLSAGSAGTVVVEGENALVAFDCRDGSTCIGEGRWRETNAYVERHGIPFETVALTERFLADAQAFRAACATA